MLDTLRELALSGRFQAGLRAGLLALIVGIAVGTLWLRRRGSLAPVAGLLFAVSTLAVLPVTRSVPTNVWAGLGLLALGGMAAGPRRFRWLFDPLLAAPGGLLIAFGTEVPGAAWIPAFVLGAILICAPLVNDFDRQYGPRGWAPPLVAVSVLGVFATVPDTKAALVLTGVALPLALLGWPISLASLGRAGSYAVVGVAVLVIVWGGHTRGGSMVGAIASLGLLVLAPLVRSIRGGTLLDGLPTGWRGTTLAALLHLPVVFLASRWAGFQQDPLPAAAMALAVGLVGGVVLSLRPQRF